jgi:AcrR family transcriptional regulator
MTHKTKRTSVPQGKSPGKSLDKSQSKAPSKARRTNVERSATTRGKLIAAAIDLLYREGFSATTTISVAAKARVSRGAMLHQFPTRVGLLLAVAEHITAEQSRHRRERLAADKFNTPMERFIAAAEVSWEVHSQPSSIALLEIIMATRSNRDLRKGFGPFVKSWAEKRRVAAVNMAADLGIADAEKIDVMIGLHQASLRGMAIELMFVQDSAHIESQRQLLADYDRHYVESLISEAQRKG